MIVRTRGESLGVRYCLHLKEVTRTSRLVSSLTGYSVQPNKAVVGASAFAHESGSISTASWPTGDVRDHGPTRDRPRGQPDRVGATGLHAFADALEKVGISVDPDHMNRAFGRFKELADRKIQITDQDLAAIVFEEVGSGKEDVLVLESSPRAAAPTSRRRRP